MTPAPPPRFPQRRRSIGRRIAWAVTRLAFVAAAGWYAYTRLKPTKSDDALTAVVVRGDLEITVTERGELESSQSVTVKCEVEREQTKLVSILPEGTPVLAGAVVAKFDTEAIQRAVAEQEIKYKQADGKAKAARKDLEIAQNKGEGEIDTAALALELAVLDRDSYLKGEYQVELDDRNGAIELAKKELKEAEDDLDFTRNLVSKGFEQLERVRAKELQVQTKQYLVNRDKAKLGVLEQFAKKKKETELDGKARDAKRQLDRVKKSGDAANEKAKSDLEAADQTAGLEKSQLERAKVQLAGCEVKAPADGIIVYFKRPWDESSRVMPGAMMYFQQPIFTLPDLTKMRVKMKVHESVVKKVMKDLPADILIDALPNQPLAGKVESVATLAQSDGWRGGAVKEYLTEVSVKDLPTSAGLKPGMTAEVKIRVKVVQDILQVPVSAVTEKNGAYVAYVKTGNAFTSRDVKVGETNAQFIEVVDGLKEGEAVALDARVRANAEAKTAGKKPAAAAP